MFKELLIFCGCRIDCAVNRTFKYGGIAKLTRRTNVSMGSYVKVPG